MVKTTLGPKGMVCSWKTVFNYTVEMFVSLTQVIQEHCQTLRDPPGQNSTKYGAWSEGDGDE